MLPHKWDDPLLPTLPIDPDRPRWAQGHVRSPQPDRLGDPGSGVVHQGEQDPIPLAAPGRRVRRRQDRRHLLAGEVSQERAPVPLRRDGQDALDDGQTGRVTGGSVLQERAQRRQAHVPGGDGIAALPLEMIQERQDRRGVQVRQGEGSRRPAPVIGEEVEQEAEHVTVGRHGAGAGILLGDESLAEELPDQCGEAGDDRRRVHGRSPRSREMNRSKRPAARSSSSGMPVRYQ